MTNPLKQAAVEMGGEASQVLTNLAKYLLSRRDRRRIKKCADLLAKSDLYERYLVSLLSFEDKKLIKRLLTEKIVEEGQSDNKSN